MAFPLVFLHVVLPAACRTQSVVSEVGVAERPQQASLFEGAAADLISGGG
jgi:hypothetical protein